YRPRREQPWLPARRRWPPPEFRAADQRAARRQLSRPVGRGLHGRRLQPRLPLRPGANLLNNPIGLLAGIGALIGAGYLVHTGQLQHWLNVPGTTTAGSTGTAGTSTDTTPPTGTQPSCSAGMFKRTDD